MVLVSVKPLTELRGDSGDESDLSACSELPCSSGFNGAKSHDCILRESSPQLHLRAISLACDTSSSSFNLKQLLIHFFGWACFHRYLEEDIPGTVG